MRTPVSEETYQAYRRIFAYEKTPLEPRMESVDDSNKRWRRERVSFNAAYNHECVPAVILLPRDVPPPYQTIILFPGTNTTESSASRGLIDLDWPVRSKPDAPSSFRSTKAPINASRAFYYGHCLTNLKISPGDRVFFLSS